MKWHLLIPIILSTYSIIAQKTVTGKVLDERGNPLFAANVYLISDISAGTTTDINGYFTIEINQNYDTLVATYIGYHEQSYLIDSTSAVTKQITFSLQVSSTSITEIVLTADDPISKDYTVEVLQKMDIYLDPIAQGDPLKAITSSASSTTTDESANVALRGSSPDQSRVLINGVPIYRPTRSNNINNQGFFSLFNPEIIDKMYVHPSNPPLIFGNSSAGLVDIRTTKELTANQLQLSTSLSNIGFILSQKLKKNGSFFQVFNNNQYSNAFIKLQASQLPNIESFRTNDIGIHTRLNISRNISLSSYNYGINELFNGYSQQFTYQGNVRTGQKRIFSVNKLSYQFKKHIVHFYQGIDRSRTEYRFGNVRSDQKIRIDYQGISFKSYWSNRISTEAGFSRDYQRFIYKDSVSTAFYALAPQVPNFYNERDINNNILDGFTYLKWDINPTLLLSTGIRQNIPSKNQPGYTSTQLSLRFKPNNMHTILLSGGQYHNYARPGLRSTQANLLRSRQAAVDYRVRFNNSLMTFSSYYKQELFYLNNTEISRSRRTAGIEYSVDIYLGNKLKLLLSHSFINQKLYSENGAENTQLNLPYFIRYTLQYSNPKLANVAVVYFNRPGNHYNRVQTATFDGQTGFYRPTFDSTPFQDTMGTYARFDFSASRYFNIGSYGIIAFFTINNIFNQINQSRPLYNKNYSARNFDNFQLRTIYFGLVWQLNYN